METVYSLRSILTVIGFLFVFLGFSKTIAECFPPNKCAIPGFPSKTVSFCQEIGKDEFGGTDFRLALVNGDFVYIHLFADDVEKNGLIAKLICFKGIRREELFPKIKWFAKSTLLQEDYRFFEEKFNSSKSLIVKKGQTTETIAEDLEKKLERKDEATIRLEVKKGFDFGITIRHEGDGNMQTDIYIFEIPDELED